MFSPALEPLQGPLATSSDDILLLRGEGRPLVDRGVGQVTEDVVVRAQNISWTHTTGSRQGVSSMRTICSNFSEKGPEAEAECVLGVDYQGKHAV